MSIRIRNKKRNVEKVREGNRGKGYLGKNDLRRRGGGYNMD